MQNRKRDTDVQNRLLDSVEEGKGRKFRENSIKTCILSMVKKNSSLNFSKGTLHFFHIPSEYSAHNLDLRVGPEKMAECKRIDAFELWCWRKLLRVPWTARRSNLLILKKSTLNIHWKDCCCS